MNKKLAMSNIGYAIVLIIILGVVMIVSAPMMADKFKQDSNNPPKTVQSEPVNNYSENFEIRDLERRLNSRIDELERWQNSSDISNKYVCTIGGTIDEDGTIVSVDSVSPDKKFVFVCEYKR